MGTTLIYGQGAGVYDHYFNTFLIPTDLLWSFLQAIVMSIAVMLVHTYYGYNASGGPAGVGRAGSVVMDGAQRRPPRRERPSRPGSPSGRRTRR